MSLGEEDPGWCLLRVLAGSKRCLALAARQAWGGGSCYYPGPGGQEEGLLRPEEPRQLAIWGNRAGGVNPRLPFPPDLDGQEARKQGDPPARSWKASLGHGAGEGRSGGPSSHALTEQSLQGQNVPHSLHVLQETDQTPG